MSSASASSDLAQALARGVPDRQTLRRIVAAKLPDEIAVICAAAEQALKKLELE